MSEAQTDATPQPDAAVLLQRESIAEPELPAEPLTVGAQLAAARVRRAVTVQQAAVSASHAVESARNMVEARLNADHEHDSLEHKPKGG